MTARDSWIRQLGQRQGSHPTAGARQPQAFRFPCALRYHASPSAHPRPAASVPAPSPSPGHAPDASRLFTAALSSIHPPAHALVADEPPSCGSSPRSLRLERRRGAAYTRTRAGGASGGLPWPPMASHGLPWSPDVDQAVTVNRWTDGWRRVVRTGVGQATWAIHPCHSWQG